MKHKNKSKKIPNLFRKIIKIVNLPALFTVFLVHKAKTQIFKTLRSQTGSNLREKQFLNLNSLNENIIVSYS
jgi:hypothetical protein